MWFGAFTCRYLSDGEESGRPAARGSSVVSCNRASSRVVCSIVNVRATHVEDNVIATKNKARLNRNRTLEDRKHFGNIRSRLIREARLTSSKSGTNNVTVTSGNFSVAL